ncbi:MAG: hypothetical protein O2894_00740 [Planctomycetota bacterium]|nr:hypothetical protein [Planctomycetota bacterium]
MQLALLLSLGLWFGGVDGDPQAAVEEVFRDYDYQRDLRVPVRNRDSVVDPRDWSHETWPEDHRWQRARRRGLPGERGAPGRREQAPDTRTEPGGGGGSGAGALLQILVWVALGIAVLTVVMSLVRNRQARAEKDVAVVSAKEQVPKAELEAPRSEAERLADDGRYDEAVHMLLLRTIEALMAARPDALPASWTSREIEGGADMPATARAPFGALVSTVEASLFGGRSAGREEWTTCLERFRAFESAYQAPVA